MLDKISKKLKKLAQKLKGSPVQDCPLAKGIICVVVTRSDTNNPIPGVKAKVEGPTPGQDDTDDLGVAQFEDRVPGDYEITVTFPDNLKHYNYTDGRSVETPWLGGVGVAGNQIRVVELQAYPTGNLEVKVYVKDKNGSESLIPKAEVETITASGPQALNQSTENPHTFERIKCGKYDVKATVVEDKYEPRDGSHDQVDVPEGGTGQAKIVVGVKTWIKVRVYDTDDKKDLAKVITKLKLLDSSDFIETTDDAGLVEAKMKHIDGNCSVQELISDGDEIYEVVDVEEV